MIITRHRNRKYYGNRLKARAVKKKPGWKDYQSRLKKSQKRKTSIKKWVKGCFLFIFLAVAVYGITGKPLNSAVYIDTPQISSPNLTSSAATSSIPPYDIILKDDIQLILGKNLEENPGEYWLNNIKDKNLDINFDGRKFHIDTTIEPYLQNFILNSMSRENARYIGIVAMNPLNGEILALAGYDRETPGSNPCTENIFPAASVFKIITAAAVVDKYGFNPESAIAFKGGKHTLYKYQLKKQAKRVHYISLKDSFAQSVNPVFGKLGIHYLGKTDLEAYAKTFGFNRPINLEIPVEQSYIYISDQTFHLAEIASGFNRTTAISPIHGALITSAITSETGKIFEPFLVKRMTDKSGRLLYQGCPSIMNQAVKPKTAKIVKRIMKETIKTGTCRKTFRRFEKDPVLSLLDIGGKTGTINSRKHEGRRFDWFVGFAGEKNGTEQIVLSVIVVHDKLIGIKARKYAKMIFKEYYRNYFTKTLTAQAQGK